MILTLAPGLSQSLFNVKWFPTTGWSVVGDGVTGTFSSSPPDVSGILHFGFTDALSNSVTTALARVLNDFRFVPNSGLVFDISFSASVEYGTITEEFDETETDFSNLTTSIIDTDDFSGDAILGSGSVLIDFDFTRVLPGGSIFGYYVTLKDVTFSTPGPTNVFTFNIDEAKGSELNKTFYLT